MITFLGEETYFELKFLFKNEGLYFLLILFLFSLQFILVLYLLCLQTNNYDYFIIFDKINVSIYINKEIKNKEM